MRDVVFLDTNYAVALAAESDQLHASAVLLAEEVAAIKPRIVTTQPVLFEIGNALCKHHFRGAAVKMLSALAVDPLVETVLLTEQLYFTAFRLFESRQDKEWSLTECLSFVVMQERGITDPLTADQHFEQSGFRVLLRP